MIKYYCDGCDTEIAHRQNVVANLIKRKAFFNGNHFEVEIMVPTEGAWQLCEECTMRVIREGVK